MRRRSNTIHAESVADYLNAAQKASSYQVNPRKPVYGKHLKNQPLEAKKLDQEEICCTDSSYSSTTSTYKNQKSVEASDPFWADFYYDCDKMKATTMPSLTLTDHTNDTDYSEDTEANHFKHAKPSVLRRVMVIGMNGSGKHSLINTLFDCGEDVSNRKNQVMDLLTKTEEDDEDGVQVRYQFWIQNLYEDHTRQEKLKEMIRTYYKNVSLFVFMYSVADKKSLECLHSAIQSAMEDVSADKFEGILIGTKGDMTEEREVSLSEGISLQEKYGLTFFEEADSQNSSLKDRLLKLLKEKEGDFRVKRGCSIISID